jgi:acyl-CoA synthetase (AMP-forming)/AMP-acid ligase II
VNYREIDAVVASLTAPDGQFPITQVEINSRSQKILGGLPDNLCDFYAFVSSFGGKDCLVSGERRYSFDEVMLQVGHLAVALREEYGVEKGDRVAIAMRNCPEWCISFMAVTALGAVVVPMNSWWLGQELAFGLKDSGATLLIADGSRLSRLFAFQPKSAIRVLGVDTGGNELPNGIDQLDAILGRSEKVGLPESTIAPEDPAMILYTSGSTGNPKGVLSTHRNVISAIGSWLVLGLSVSVLNGTFGQEPESQPAILLTVPLFHVTGLNSLFLLSLLIGRKIVMMRKWDADVALKLIQKEKVTHFNGVPTMSMELVRHPELDRYDVSSLVDVSSGGAAYPAQYVAKIVERIPGALPSAGYGLTETNAVGCVIGQEDYLGRPGSVGRPVPPLTEIKIVDEAGDELAGGEVGEIWIRSPAVPEGYWQLEEETKKTFNEGWCHTGDLGYLDDEGFLFIVDRLKDIIIRGGENISCLELEEVLYSYPEITEAAVFGLPDDRLGEVVGAVVATASGRPIDIQKLRDFLVQHVAAFKVPERIWCYDGPMPRIASGKIAKKTIREEILAHRFGKE